MPKYITFESVDGKTRRFAADAADSYSETTRWDGNNHISRATGSQWEHEELYRTLNGSWVLNHWSQWQGSRTTYREISTRQAVEWLLINELHEDLDDLADGDPLVTAEVEEASDRGPRSKSDESRADERLVVRVTTAQKQRIETIAKDAGLKVSEYVLGRVL